MRLNYFLLPLTLALLAMTSGCRKHQFCCGGCAPCCAPCGTGCCYTPPLDGPIPPMAAPVPPVAAPQVPILGSR